MHLTDEQLNEYLDDAIPNRAQVDLHLASCADCASRLTALQSLAAEIESLPQEVLPRNLAAAVTSRLASPGEAISGLPRWLTWTAGLQTAAAVIVIAIGAPLLIEAFSTSMPILQAPSLTETIFEAQAVWSAWLDILSQFQWPSMPELPASLELSSFYVLLTLAGTAMVWLVGNGLLLRNQVK